MKEYIAVIVVVLLLPYVVTVLYQGSSGIREAAFEVNAEETDENEKMIIGALAAAIPSDYPEEAMKAQAIILRTQLEERPVKSYSVNEMKELWGIETFSGYYSWLKRIVKETRGQIMTCGGVPVFAPYHAVSAGFTRDADKLFGAQTYPYLKAVECRTDVEADGYLSIVYYTKEEFRSRLLENFPQSGIKSEDILTEIRIKSTDQAGYVETMEIGEQEVLGEEFRKKMDMASASFTLEEYQNQIRIVTKGLGHGLGFDQYYAKKLAEEGKSAAEILNYFFQGIIIEQKSE